MNDLTINRKQILTIITLIILLIGLIASVYLVQTKQIFKSKATADITSGLKITEDNGQEVPYLGNNTFEVTSDYINVSIKNLNELINF